MWTGFFPGRRILRFNRVFSFTAKNKKESFPVQPGVIIIFFDSLIDDSVGSLNFHSSKSSLIRVIVHLRFYVYRERVPQILAYDFWSLILFIMFDDSPISCLGMWNAKSDFIRSTSPQTPLIVEYTDDERVFYCESEPHANRMKAESRPSNLLYIPLEWLHTLIHFTQDQWEMPLCPMEQILRKKKLIFGFYNFWFNMCHWFTPPYVWRMRGMTCLH